MRPLTGPAPTPAEHANSALRRCHRATLTPGDAEIADSGSATTDRAATGSAGDAGARVALAHQVPGTADLWVAIPAARAATIPFGGQTARLEVVDVVVGGAAAGRCRRIVVVEGSVELPGTRAQRFAATDIARDLPEPALLDVGAAVSLVRLRPERVLLTDHDGVTRIETEDLATSGPDPFSDIEGHWLEHLNDRRCAIVPRLAARVCRCLPAERPLLVGIDRTGVVLELTGRDEHIHRERLPFAESANTVTELGTQIRLLAHGARYPHTRASLRP